MARRRSDLLVFAAHPDDESLGCAGVIMQAVAAGKRVDVAIFTNGDAYTGAAAVEMIKLDEEVTAADFRELGRIRQEESVGAMAKLGVPSANVNFLGYPDGVLSQVYESDEVPITSPYTNQSETYGPSRLDYHSRLHGEPAPYTWAAAAGDAADLIRRLRPRAIYVHTELDQHADHKAAFWFVRDAVNETGYGGPVFTFQIHGEDWPSPPGTTPTQGYTNPLGDADVTPEGLPWPPPVRVNLAYRQALTKLRAIRAYPTQTAVDRDYLEAFCKADEVFWEA